MLVVSNISCHAVYHTGRKPSDAPDGVAPVIATEGRRFRNKTPISQWEANLSPHFIRIHRSYLVNKAAVSRIDGDLLSIGDIQLPISRKYKTGTKIIA